MKLVKIKTLEGRLWKLCKEIIRAKYSHKCISCQTEVEGRSLHTGHMFRKRFLPIQMKYDLRILFPQCSYCNLRLHGNLEWYFPNVITMYGFDYVCGITKDIRYWEKHPMNTAQTRQFLLDLEQQYVNILSSYQRASAPVN